MAEQVALLDSVNETARETYRGAGLEIVDFKKGVTQQELADKASNALGLGVRSGPEVTAEAMGDDLEFINVFGAGTSHITRTTEDGLGADDRGIPIFNASHENTRSVAELALGCTIVLFRDLHGHDRSMRDGVWSKTNGREIRGKTMGIIGHGTIGSQLAVMAESLNMDVVAYDPVNKFRQGRAKSLDSMEEVLAVADITSLHVPGGEANHHIIDADAIKLMKQGSYLINAARGELVDYEALLEDLDDENGRLAGAAIDVYTDGTYKEPEKGETFDHSLRGHPKVLCLPHIGGSTAEAQAGIGRSVALKSLGYLATGNTTGSVNMPNLALNGIEPGTSRLLNVHDNHPGVIAKLSTLIAEAGLNVSSIAQRVRGEIGYVAFGVDGEIPDEALSAIRAFEATRRARIVS